MEIKIISLNVWQGGNLMPGILDFLRHEDADVVMLQEVYDGKDPSLAEKYRTMQVLREQLLYPHDIFAPAYTDDRQEGHILQGNAIFSKFPIANHENHFLVKPERATYIEVPENFPFLPRVLQVAMLQINEQSVTVANMHGVWDMDGDNDSQQRQQMVDIVLDAVMSRPHVIIAGDTNAKDSNPAMKRLDEYFPSVFGEELTTTFNMRQKSNPGYATAAVDHMYVGDDVRVLTRDCPDIDISDHLPLVVTLELN